MIKNGHRNANTTKGNTMREEILESIERMTKDDCKDVQITLGLTKCTKAHIKQLALDDEAVAEYVLMY